jgi:site-specific DNA-methyltransferase (adenine-specific)
VNTLAKKAVLYEDATKSWRLVEGDALAVLAGLPEHSVDAVVTDPPYGIRIAGEAWDGTAIRRAPGAEGLGPGEAFERWTQAWAEHCHRVLKPGGHLLAFGSPRTFHRLVAGIEDAGLEVRDQILWLYGQGMPKSRRLPGGLGTTLKPAYEPILLARKPICGRTIENIETFGTGALNIDATRIASTTRSEGYWPADVALSHSPDCPVGLLDGDRAGPSRLFYCAKATRLEREAGCDELPLRSIQLYTGKRQSPRLVRNLHPTVKPVELMRWLVRLVAPPGGVVVDPFCGSGSTGIAAVLEGRQFLGVEREPAYVEIACARLAHWAREAARESL